MSEVNENQLPGTPTWLDLHVPDVTAAKAYYGRVFGWEFGESSLGTTCLLRGLPVAGIRQGTGGWRAHLATDDCDATAKAVVAAGGSVVEEPHEVGDLGRAAVVLTSCDLYDRFPPPVFKPLAALVKVPGATWLIMQSLRPRFAQRLPIAFGWVTKRLPEPAVIDSYLAPGRSSRGVRRDLGKVFGSVDARYTIEAAEKLKSFRKPVLLAWAAEDKLFPVEYARRLAADLPDATLEEIDDSYTFIPEDQPERLAEAIATFVRRPATVSA